MTSKHSPYTAIELLSDEERRTLSRRLAYVMHYMDICARRTTNVPPRELNALVAAIAADRLEIPPHYSTVRRWIRWYLDSRTDPLSLVGGYKPPRRRRAGPPAAA